MTENNPITPPPELVQQWWDGTHGAFYEFAAVALQATRWGADQELESCCEWLFLNGWGAAVNSLRAARRPEPPSLAEKAFDALDRFDQLPTTQDKMILIRALERLQELEKLSDDQG